MFEYTDVTGAPLSRDPMGIKARIAKVYQKPGQPLKSMMDEMSQLSDKDIADFSAWFEEEGYPIKRA